MVNPIEGVNVIVAVGSVDGMAGTAACLRHAGDPTIHLVFTQAFQVNSVDVAKWPPNSKVGLIDLGVNNEGHSPNPQMTVDFVNKIYNSGHSILFIADEHGKKAWHQVLEQCGHSKDELTIKPRDRGEKYQSSCAILAKALGDAADAHTQALLRAGDQADQMNFNTRYGEIFNLSVKSNMADPERRPYVVRHMAEHESTDAKIRGWMREYANLRATQPKIMQTGMNLGDGISFYDGRVGPHDATSVFAEAYKNSSIVALGGTEVFLQGQKQVGASIATNRKDLNLLQIVQQAGINSGGMAAKVNLALEDLTRAIEVIRHEL